MAYTVLIVDDDPATCDLVEDVLSNDGYRIERATGGRPALERLQSAPPDLILLDLVMPEMDGWEVLRVLGSMSAAPAVVVVSAQTAFEPRPLPQCVGGFVPKPFDLAQLRGTCEAVLTRQRVVDAAGLRRDPRRTFLVRATLVSETAAPLVTVQVHNISRRGLSVDLPSLPEGAPLSLSIEVPGMDRPLLLPGRVAWKRGIRAGVEIGTLDDETRARLAALVEPGV